MTLPFRAALVLLAVLSTPLAAQTACTKLVDMSESSLPEAKPADIAIAKAIFGPQAHDITVNARLTGHAFTRKGAMQTLLVLQQGGPDATDPQGQEATLAVFGNGSPVLRLRTRLGNFITASGDVDGDGIDEILLRADAYNMGQGVTRLTLVKFVDGKLRTLRQFDEAVVDACDSGGTLQAATISYCPRAGHAMPDFQVATHAGKCHS
jgi:hypothetical protein